jgi:hypothetical protein
MIKSIYFPKREFTTQDELFKALRENVDKIITCKKAEIYNSHAKLLNDDGTAKFYTGFVLKTDTEECKTGPQMKTGYCYPVINSTNYRDSHKDCHFDGIWDKSAKEQDGKLYYVADHKIETNTIIAWPENVKVMVKTVPWSWLGKNYEGNTQALIYEINKADIVNDNALKIIEAKRPVQNSVRMQYVKIKLGMNSSAKEDIEYKKYYDEKINLIANKDEVEADGYFFGVEEAKIIREGSMVPLGSNDATPIRQKDEADTITSEHKDEPVIPTTPTTATKLLNPNFY